VILELLFGVIVSAVVITVLRAVNIRHSANSWILTIAKFVYAGGHPLLDDGQRFERITKEYKSVVISFSQVILKIAAIIMSTLGTIALLATLYGLIRGRTLPALFSPEFVKSIFPEYLLHWPFIVGTFLPLTLLPFLPKTARDEEYSALDKFLHYLFVGNRGMAKLQFRFECFVNRKSILSTAPSQHIYVSGLARSGSTSLMQYLGQLPEFVSLSYQNMPFVFLPRTGPKLNSRKRPTERERSHKDGMRHSLSTYEALEEPFWLHFAGPDFVGEDRLTSHSVTEDVHVKYRKFRALVARDKTYLAKNNNHLLRAKSLHQLDAEKGLCTRTVIPFREPYAQAKSLLEQHKLLSTLQKENDFAMDYMDMLLHHEFGLHVKTTFLDGSAGGSLPDSDPNTLEHWLDVWHLFYRAVFDLYGGEPGFCFFCYENYLKNPRGSLLSLCSFIDVAPEQFKSVEVKEWVKNRSEQVEDPDTKLTALYDLMEQGAINHEA
jgi:hypothetical protein